MKTPTHDTLNATETHLTHVSSPFPVIALVLSSLLLLNGCAAIGDIFKAGMWVGVVIVVAIVALVGGGIAMFRKK